MTNRASDDNQKFPDLRFPEFQGTIGWNCDRLSNLIRTVVPPKKIPTTQYNTTGRFPIIDQSQNQLAGWTDDADAVIDSELPLIVFGDHTCVLKLLNKSFAQGADGIKIFSGSEAVDTLYLFQALHANPLQMQAYKRHFSVLKERRVYFPDKETGEQKKIADCLFSVDALIEAEGQKLEALQLQMKGLMQELFPAEGETIPKRRFREFENDLEWEEKAIGDFGDVVTGSTPSTSQTRYYGDRWQFVSPADISDARFIESTKINLSDEGLSVVRKIKENSVLFVCIGSTIGKMAQNKEACATNQQINAIVPNEYHSSDFIYFLLSSISKKIAALAGRQAVPIINKSNFSAVRVRCPKLPEQMRIADCLSSITETITAQSQKLDALRTHKEGLMQRLFPAVSEVEHG
ncbi:restriction endonuclease subunit S [Rhizobium sp. 11_C7_N12_5]|uniref:restriction endonuclease subunit S n=1 Tax=Rhizobium sp. 11_C7_N12_5 TaxID=3240770 RepID=UPI003F271353